LKACELFKEKVLFCCKISAAAKNKKQQIHKSASPFGILLRRGVPKWIAPTGFARNVERLTCPPLRFILVADS
jgi:hypothetical protein